MNQLDPSNTTLLLIDWQERLFPAMPESIREYNLRQTSTLCWLARELSMSVIVSEQYPKGLGPSLAALEVEDAIEKIHFSAMREPIFAQQVKESNSTKIILTGMETHICVAQTCRDLIAAGYDVLIPADAVLSRKKLDWHYGLQRMQEMGAMMVTAEAILFELLEKAGGVQFKEVSRRIR